MLYPQIKTIDVPTEEKDADAFVNAAVREFFSTQHKGYNLPAQTIKPEIVRISEKKYLITYVSSK